MSLNIKTFNSCCFTVSLLLPGMWMVAGLGGCRLDVPEGQTPGGVLLGRLRKKTRGPSYKVLMEQLSSPDADVRREAILSLAQGKTAQLKATPELLGVVALDDKNSLVKATAVEAMGIYGDWPRLIEVLEQTARDESALVRLATVKVLRSVKHNEKSLKILLGLLAKETDEEVQSETAEALGDYPDRRVLRGLIGTVAADVFRVSYLSRQSLVQLTGQDYQYDDDAWRRWLAKTENPFQGKGD